MEIHLGVRNQSLSVVNANAMGLCARRTITITASKVQFQEAGLKLDDEVFLQFGIEGVTIMVEDLTVSYPVVITHDNADGDYPYEVYIPAFEGYTQGRNMANAILMARDFIGLSAMDLREDGKALPHPGALPNKTQDDQTVMLVVVNVDDYQRRQDK